MPQREFYNFQSNASIVEGFGGGEHSTTRACWRRPPAGWDPPSRQPYKHGQCFGPHGTLGFAASFSNSAQLTIAPGSVLGTNGDFTQTSTGTTNIQIGGTQASPTIGNNSRPAAILCWPPLEITSSTPLNDTTHLQFITTNGGGGLTGVYSGVLKTRSLWSQYHVSPELPGEFHNRLAWGGSDGHDGTVISLKGTLTPTLPQPTKCKAPRLPIESTTATISQLTGSTLASLTVKITNLQDAPNEILDANTTGTAITKSYDANTGR